MSQEILDNRDFHNEFVFSASRSSGPGGQHVNKVNTRIELRFDVQNSLLLNDEEKKLIFEELGNKINNDGQLIIVSQNSRSQIKNKESAIEKFYKLIIKALTPKKERKVSNPPPSVKEKRLSDKHKQSEKKVRRDNPKDYDQ